MIRFRSRSSTIALAAFVAAASSTVALAQPATPATAGSSVSKEVRLSLADAIALSLENNPEIAIAGFAPRKAAAEVKQQRGVFDPVLSLFAGAERDKTPAGSTASGSLRAGVTADARLQGRLPLGTEYELSYGTTRFDSDSLLSPTNPSWTSHVQLSMRQPLLRGFGTDVNRAGITIARGNERIAELGLHRYAESALMTTVAAYWRLVRAHRSLVVARESLELAQRLVTLTQTRVKAGDLPTIELTQARASVAAREEALILGEAEVGNANDALARLLVVDARDAFAVTFVPTEEPSAGVAPMNGTALLAEALRQRAELQAARQAVKNAEVALTAASDARRPDLSAVGSFGIGGVDSSWTSAHSRLMRGSDDQHRWAVGLMFSLPLGNRSADGAYEKARLARDEARLSLRTLELMVAEEVRSSLRDLAANAKRVEATRRAAELARAQLDAGEKRMSTGLSTAFEVLRLQTDLAAAQNAEIAAIVGYRTSLARVQFATGSGHATRSRPIDKLSWNGAPHTTAAP